MFGKMLGGSDMVHKSVRRKQMSHMCSANRDTRNEPERKQVHWTCALRAIVATHT